MTTDLARTHYPDAIVARAVVLAAEGHSIRRIESDLAGSAQPSGLSTDVHGDSDCDGDVDAFDALLILRFVAGLPVNLPQACDPLGS